MVGRQNIDITVMVIDKKAEFDKARLTGSSTLWSTATDINPVRANHTSDVEIDHRRGVVDSYVIYYRNDVFWTINVIDLISSIDRLFHERFPSNKFTVICRPIMAAEQNRKARYDRIIDHFDRSFDEAPTRYLELLETSEPDGGDKADEVNTPFSDIVRRSRSRDDSPFSRITGWSLDDDDDDDDYSDDDEDDDDPDDDEDDDDDASRSKRGKYARSQSIKNADHPKRDIKLHRIVIASKKDIEADQKVIKTFLRDFIPGKENWVKEYRAEMADRWIRALAIKKKAAKRREKEFKAASSKTRVKRQVRSIETVANRVLNSKPYSAFYDPNK